MHILVVDLLAERVAFGRSGVKEILSHFLNPQVSLWSPHTTERVEYGFGTVVESPVSCDLIIITGSKRNVSMWENWMDDVSRLIQTAEVPIIGICFGHQIIAASLGGKVERADENSAGVCEVHYNDGKVVNAVFTHQDHVVDAGELEVIASAVHCKIAACRHPHRPILSVQFHPEAVQSVLDDAIECGEMTLIERQQFDLSQDIINTKESLLAPLRIGDYI